VKALFVVDRETVRREGRGQPLGLGRTPGRAEDLYLWLRPTEPEVSDWIADRLHQRLRPERTLLLVPTPRLVRVDTFERHGPGQPVEIVHLERALTVDGGQIVRVASGAPPLRLPWPTEPVLGRGIRLQVPAGVRWPHITIEHVDDDILGVRIGAHPPVRVVAAELGLTRETSGKLSDLWVLLRTLCEDGGTTTRARVRAPNVNALRIQATRLSELLCAAFGIPDTPLHVEGRTETVRADFVALPEPRRTTRRRDRRGPR
jgi:hypothetical protein